MPEVFFPPRTELIAAPTPVPLKAPSLLLPLQLGAAEQAQVQPFLLPSVQHSARKFFKQELGHPICAAWLCVTPFPTFFLPLPFLLHFSKHQARYPRAFQSKPPSLASPRVLGSDPGLN